MIFFEVETRWETKSDIIKWHLVLASFPFFTILLTTEKNETLTET